MKPTIGYLSGTDAATLSQLTATGYNTIPLSNGWDNHGRYIGMMTVADRIGAVVGYFHKVVAPPEADAPPVDFLERARIHKIPVIIICPQNVMDQARKMLGDSAGYVHWVTPDQVFAKVSELLGNK